MNVIELMDIKTVIPKKEYVSCKGCVNSKRNGRYFSCSEQVGTFPLGAKFENCKEYISKKDKRK